MGRLGHELQEQMVEPDCGTGFSSLVPRHEPLCHLPWHALPETVGSLMVPKLQQNRPIVAYHPVRMLCPAVHSPRATPAPSEEVWMCVLATAIYVAIGRHGRGAQ